MKNILKKILSFALSILFVFSVTRLITFAKSGDEHNLDTATILFGTQAKIDKYKNSSEMKLLYSALFLAIDQNRDIDGKEDLKRLKEEGVDCKFDDVKDISYTPDGGQGQHRSYTHRGWDWDYSKNDNEEKKQDKAKWSSLRKPLIISTVNKIFDFHGNDKKSESFSALLYYIHIIGDYQADSSYYIKNGLKIAFGGTEYNSDVIGELLKHISVIFENQRSTFKYKFLISSLEFKNNQYKRLVKKDGGINSDDRFKERQRIVNSVYNTLKFYIPDLLKDENFFSDVFY